MPCQSLSGIGPEVLRTGRAESNPFLAALQKSGDYGSARVGRSHRALAVEDGSDFIWVWIGHHDEYDRLIS